MLCSWFSFFSTLYRTGASGSYNALPPGPFPETLMAKIIANRWRLLLASLATLFLSAVNQPPVHSQQIGEAERVRELRRLRDELKQSNSLRNEDVVVTIGERTIIEAARLLVGLEICMANGG